MGVGFQTDALSPLWKAATTFRFMHIPGWTLPKLPESTQSQRASSIFSTAPPPAARLTSSGLPASTTRLWMR